MTDAHEDYLVMALLAAVAGEEAATAAYLALSGVERPTPGPEQSEGSPS